jgi:hypothetical protein
MKIQKNQFFSLLFLFIGLSVFAQERSLLRGKVMYRDSNVINENVLNVTAELATITNEDGQFEIMVALGDELIFTAVNYKIIGILITQEIINNKRLVVSVDEKITALEEVVIGPENTEKFLALKNEKFRGYTYEIDRSTEVDNIAESGSVRGMQNGLNFVSLFKLLFNSNDGTDSESISKIKLSDVLRQVFEDRFFIDDLQLPPTQIEPFLFYVDAQVTPESLLKKENEFQLIDFLVNQSKGFLSTLDE